MISSGNMYHRKETMCMPKLPLANVYIIGFQVLLVAKLSKILVEDSI